MPRSRHVRLSLTVLLAAGLLAGCGGSAQQDRLKKTSAHAKRLINQVNRDVPSRVAFLSTIEGGGSVVSYIYASTARTEGLAPIYFETPETNWCIVIHQQVQGNKDILCTLAAYGDSLGKPLFTEHVTVKAQQKPR
ncbi:MAG: hypothetical protein JXR37_18750 [Kiritimatiellae bacterium]|nr:hypothetical protein [Kiritimatiellia bacterium]